MTSPDRSAAAAAAADIVAAENAAIPYLRRVRTYYQALGYRTPYEWARESDVPFTPLRRPLSEARVAIVTTAAPRRTGLGTPRSPNAYDAVAKFFTVYSGTTTGAAPDLRIDHVAIDFAHTTGADLGSFFPLAALRRACADGRVGAVAGRFHGVPTNRSQRTTREVDSPEVVARCRVDGVDAAILVPNCPVCHQTMALVANALEASGIASVVMGCARDIVEHVGTARFVFSDFPLGNAAGRPHDAASQDATLAVALDLLERASAPRTTVSSTQRWSESAAWRLDYCNVEQLSADEIARRREEFDRGKARAKVARETRA